jgi:hypothetical protein
MNPISKRSFPKHPLAKRPLGKPWAPASSQAPGAASRHLRWAEGIASKRVRCSRWLGLHPEAMTLTQPFRQRILRLQTMLRHSHSETRLLYSPMQERKAASPAGPNSHLEDRRPFSVLPQIIVERSRSLISFVREILRGSTPMAMSVAAVQRNRTLEFVDKIATPRLSRSTIEGATVPLALSSARRRSTHKMSQSDETDSTTLPERVLRKHRRIETRPLLRSRESTSQIVPALMPETSSVIHRAPTHRPAQQRFDTPTEPASREHSVRQAPNINVAQITDAVLQQLDRRLIAARERMGRI